jgi:hypothetical protein
VLVAPLGQRSGKEVVIKPRSLSSDFAKNPDVGPGPVTQIPVTSLLIEISASKKALKTCVFRIHE